MKPKSLDTLLFGKKKFGDLLEEIYTNQKKKENQISNLINELKPLINEIGDATLVVPLIRDYLEMGIKNDEQLVKIATIIQRLLQNNTSSEDIYSISEAEKSQLLSEINKIHDKK
jgi:nucleoside-triphosphatase THEP1